MKTIEEVIKNKSRLIGGKKRFYDLFEQLDQQQR